VLPPRWLADEMLGRLARYLRFVGEDTAWVRDLDDEEVVRQAEREERFLLTRDRRLAERVPNSLLLSSPDIGEQWRSLRHRFPTLPSEVKFVRCSLCNGRLAPYHPSGDRPLPAGVPEDRVLGGLPLYQCGSCGHLYWEGSHTSDIRRRLRTWSTESVA